MANPFKEGDIVYNPKLGKLKVVDASDPARPAAVIGAVSVFSTSKSSL